MPLSIKSIIQQAMLAAAPALVLSCGPADVHRKVTVAPDWSDGGAISGDLNATECLDLCTGGIVSPCMGLKSCSIDGPTGDGGLEIDCNEGPPRDPSQGLCTGRRPAGLRAAGAGGNSVVGAYFARCAHLEAASVVAFRRMREELAAHGAPLRLVRAAESARRDEVRHARAMRRLAARAGAPVPRVQVARSVPRSLAELALENAVEGCVRETYGAAIGAFQARAAHSAGLRKTLSAIARDEAAHAQLSWDVHAWAMPQLSAVERRRIRAHQLDAVAELRDAASPGSQLQHVAGLPDAGRARALHQVLARQLWRS